MAKNSQNQSVPENIVVDLGIPELIDLEHLGYLPSRPEVILSRQSRRAVKRLSLTLERDEARLADGTLVRNSVQKTIVWLCERFAESVENNKAAQQPELRKHDSLPDTEKQGLESPHDESSRTTESESGTDEGTGKAKSGPKARRKAANSAA